MIMVYGIMMKEENLSAEPQIISKKVFQQDNDPKLTSELGKEWIRLANVKLLEA